MSESSEVACASRICGTLEKSTTNISPIQGYEEAPVVSLAKAAESLYGIVPRVEEKVWLVMENSQNPLDNLTPNESASIMLYTLPWAPVEDSLYYILNDALRREDKKALRPWFLYLKLLITALSKLPSVPQTVYRGVKRNLMEDFKEKELFPWWSFNSTTTNVQVLDEELFLGKIGERTMFNINCYTGKNIRGHSMFKKESEVLLLPGFQFKKVGILNQGNGLNIIQIEEIDPPHSLSALCRTNAATPPTKTPPSLLPTKAHSSVPYQNATLEQSIQKSQSKKLNLSGQQLKEEDIIIVSERGLIEKQFKVVDLTYTGITQQCMLILSDAIRGNQFLEELNISNNSILDLGIHYLASAINSSALKRISLIENDVSDAGVRFLAEMLETNTKLIQLSLSQNRISNDGVKVLANVLIRGNTTLEILDLSANESIDNESIDVLKDMFKFNQSLKKLDLRGCDFSEDGERELLAVAKSRKKIQLWLSHVM